jgi:hypothetical protein
VFAILRTQIDMIADRELARSLRDDIENIVGWLTNL